MAIPTILLWTGEKAERKMQWEHVWEIYYVKKSHSEQWGSPRGKRTIPAVKCSVSFWVERACCVQCYTSSDWWRYNLEVQYQGCFSVRWMVKTESQVVVIIQIHLGKRKRSNGKNKMLSGVFKEKVGFRLLVRIWDLCWGHGLFVK